LRIALHTARELALRVVLGASMRRVLAQFVSESLLLGALGGAAGLTIAIVGIRQLVGAAPQAFRGCPRLACTRPRSRLRSGSRSGWRSRVARSRGCVWTCAISAPLRI